MIPADIGQLFLLMAFLASLVVTFYCVVRIVEASIKRIQRLRVGMYSEIIIATVELFLKKHSEAVDTGNKAHGDTETEAATTDEAGSNSEQYTSPSTYQH